MKTKLFFLVLLTAMCSGTDAQYAFVTGATPVTVAPPPLSQPPACVVVPVRPRCYPMAAPCRLVMAPPPVAYVDPTVSYSVLGNPYLNSCSTPPVVYHVPAPNVVYFGRPESHLKNYLNSGYARTQSSVIYFGRGEAVQRGYYFNYCR